MNDKLIFDAHTHFNDSSYESEGFLEETILAEAQMAGVGYFLNCAFDLNSAQKALDQFVTTKNVFVAVGIHPTEVIKAPATTLQTLQNLAQEPRVVAIGEVGLDYFWDADNHEKQKQWLIKQIQIAQTFNLTLMLHIRDQKDHYEAYDDVLDILTVYNLPRMIVHCFSANWDYAQKFLDLGCYLNIGGAVTFKNALALQEAVKKIPLNRLLVETDAPYLAPHPFRGQKNFPKLIVHTVKKIADLKNISFSEVVAATTQNAFQVFNLNPD